MSLIAAAIVTAGAAVADDPVVFKMDPIELVNGREVEGDESITHEHGRFEYRFANEANRDAFRADPRRYEIQMDGGCGFMGSLSGVGKPDRYAVFDGHIYVFASDGCKASFLKAPERMIEIDDERPTNVSRDAIAPGEALLDQAIEALGGAERLKNLRSIRYENTTETDRNGEPSKTVRTHSYLFPHGYHMEAWWNDHYYWSQAFDGSAGWTTFDTDLTDDEPIKVQVAMPAAARELVRHRYREPVALLYARHRPDFLACADGSGTLDGREVAYVKVFTDGSLHRLGIDAESGRVLSFTYRDRGPGAYFGTIEKRYADFETINGLTLPRSARLYYEGEPLGDEARSHDVIRVDEPGDYEAMLKYRP